MPADWNPGTQFVQGISIGGNLATAALGEGLRMQELKSQQALQQANERHIAAQTAALVNAQQMKIQEQADTAKAWTKINAETAPTLGFAPDASGEGMIPVPNPNRVPLTESLMRNLAPVVNAFHPDKMGAFVADVGSLQQRQALAAQAGLPKPLTPEAADLLKAKAEQARSATDLNTAKTLNEQMGGTKAGVQTPFQRDVADKEARYGRKLTQQEYDSLFDVHMGLKARAAVVHDMTEAQYIDKHIDKVMLQPIISTTDRKGKTFFRTPNSRQEARDYLKQEFQQSQSAPPATPPAQSQAPSDDDVWMKRKDGSRILIPKENVDKAKQRGYTIFEG